jgi:hypothetical protein
MGRSRMRNMFYLPILLLSAAPTLLFAADFDHDGLEDAFEQELIDQFRPILFYDSWDTFALAWDRARAPTSVMWYVGHSRLRYHSGGTIVFSKEELADDPTRILSAHLVKGFEDKPSDALVQPEGPTDYHLDPDGGDYRGEPPYYTPVGMYAHVVAIENNVPYEHDRLLETKGTLLVQYWQFFAFNDAIEPFDIANHEGDWLYLEAYVERKAPFNLRYLVYHHHGDGKCHPTILGIDGPLPYDQIPQCYIEAGSHEWWPNASEGGECTFSGFDNGSHNGKGPQYRAANVKNLGERSNPMNDREAQLILQFNGKWGNDSDPGGDPPEGPIYQQQGNAYPDPFRFLTCSPTLIQPSDLSECRPINGALVWREYPLSAAYRVQMGTSPTFSTGLLIDNTQPDSSISYNDLNYDRDYYWRVATNAPSCNEDIWSEVRVFHTALKPPLGVPDLLSPADGTTTSDTSGTLDWADVTNAAYYNVLVTCARGTTAASGIKLHHSEYKYTLPPGDYRWSATAYNACGTSVGRSAIFSLAVQGQSRCFVPIQYAPQDGFECGSETDTLVWQAIPGASGYIVQFARDRCGQGDEIYTPHAQLIVSQLQYDRTYYWSVRADCPCAEFSGCRSFSIVKNPSHVGMPTPLFPENGAQSLGTDGILVWAALQDAVKYEVQIGDSCGYGPLLTTQSLSAPFTNLEKGTNYFWRVRAIDSCGRYSLFSTCSSFRTLQSAGAMFSMPDSIRGPRGALGVEVPIRLENRDGLSSLKGVVNVDANRLEITGWAVSGTRSSSVTNSHIKVTTTAHEADFRIDYSSSCEGALAPGNGAILKLYFNIVPMATSGSASLQFAALPKVNACDGSVPEVSVRSGIVQVVDSTEAESTLESLSVQAPMPNPARGPVSIQFMLPTSSYCDINVIGLRGQVVARLLHGNLSAGHHEVRWDGIRAEGGRIAPGAYFILIKTSTGQVSRRLVLVR